LLDLNQVDWLRIGTYLLVAVVAAAGFYFGVLFWLPSNRVGLGRTHPHSGSYRGYQWTATVGMKGSWGRYFAFLDELRSPEGTELSRLYGPDAEALDGNWTPPPAVRKE